MRLLGGDCGKSFGTKVHADSDDGIDVGVAAWIFGRISRASSGFAERNSVRYGAVRQRFEHARCTGASHANDTRAGTGRSACLRWRNRCGNYARRRFRDDGYDTGYFSFG
jgi:hypothetical protein